MFVFPLIGGILCIIAFFSPAMSIPFYSGRINFWFWGMFETDGLSFIYERLDIMIVGIIIGAILLISGIKLVYSANLVRTEKKTFTDQNRTWIRMPLFVILSGITWFFYISNSGDGFFTPPGVDVWYYFYMDIGLIGAFSGGTLTILGYIFNKAIRETEIMSYFITTPRKEIIIPHKKFPASEIQTTQQLETPNFCPMCGFKPGTTYKFCPGCGFKF